MEMSRRILLADDSVTIQKVIELTFMDEDYEVTAVGNGDEAVAELGRSAPDLVLADVHMPGANGYEVCRRSRELHPQVPVLLLVGTFEPFDEARSREVGAAAFLKKPFDSQELLQLVARLLGRGAAAAPEPEPAAVYPESEEPAVWAEETKQPGAVTDFGRTGPTAAFPGAAAWAESHLEVAEVAEEAEESLEAAPAFYGEPVAAPAEEAEPFRWDVEPEELVPEPFAEPEPVFLATPPTAPRAIGFGGLEPFEPQAEAPAAPAPVAVPAPTGAALSDSGLSESGLSESDIDRIARRVAELVGDRVLRDVAWEVVPDMAEVVIKQRIRELESQVE
jgi:CheY-like chemotaxis protein